MKKLIKTAVILFLAAILFILGADWYVRNSTKQNITTDTYGFDADCILILGCGVRPDGTPSPMLYDRIKRGVELYQDGAAPKILMSGDHGQDEYDEVNVMKEYALDMGVPEADIFLDHAGFSTYDSLYRAKEIFQLQKIILVTQEYHLYRGLYIAKAFDIDALGVAGDYRDYAGQEMRNIREILARVKDFTSCIFKPKPKYLGEAIPVIGDGRITNG